MNISMGIESGNRGIDGIVPTGPGCWVSDISIFKALLAFLRFLFKCQIASFRLNRKRLKDKDNYYFKHIEHIKFEVET